MKKVILLLAVALMSVTVLAQEPEDKNKLTESDRLQIAVQQICPVSGLELGSKGEPVKVKAGDQIAFLCCKECQSRKLRADHWKVIQKNIAAAQATCPIMGQPVDASMKSTVVKGQQVFVCCPPCIAKIQADADGSLKKVNANYAKYVAAKRQKKSDQQQAEAQAICPVSGETLGSLDQLVKVKVGEDVVFLCCKECIGKKINAEHWKTVQQNLAKEKNK